MLEKNPIELVFSQSRRVKTIRADKNEPEWVLNIKRGIANLVQVSPKSDKMETKQILTTKTPVVIDQKEVGKHADLFQQHDLFSYTQNVQQKIKKTTHQFNITHI